MIKVLTNQVALECMGIKKAIIVCGHDAGVAGVSIVEQTDGTLGRGIDFAAGDEDSNWRWVEQWTPHAAWFLYAISLQAAVDL